MLTELSECCAVKLFAIVYSDFFGYAEVAYNVLLEELLQSGGRNVAKSFGFDPLQKVLYGDCCILEVAWCCWQWSHDIDAPPCEGLDWGYEMDFFRWEPAVVGMLLAIWASAHDFVGVCYGRRPVKSFAESLSHQSPRSDVRRAHSRVYF